MASKRQELLRQAAKRGKYAPLYYYLTRLIGREWQATFDQVESVLGFKLPDSARIHRPWWANQGRHGGHSHALAWEMAGWKTSQVKMSDERLVFLRDYTEDELNSIWEKLTASGDSLARNDQDDRPPTVVLENTATKQQMMLRASPPEVSSYTDFDPRSDYPPTTVVYARVRAIDREAWGPWVGETLESSMAT